MSYDIKSYAVASHAWFFREGDASVQGTTPTSAQNAAGAGNAGALYLPKADEANWIGSGDLEDWDDSIAQDEEKEVRRANLGTLTRKDIITIFQSMDFKLTTNDLPWIAVEAFYRTSTKLSDAQTQFVPLTITPRKYWLKLQRYTHENALIFAANLWVRMKVTGGMKGGNGSIIMPEYTCRLLDSPLNTTAFGQLA